MAHIAFLGLGAMGRRMAARLIGAGHRVTTWNRSPRQVAGAESAATPRRAAAGADVVISMVTDVEASRAVWLDPEEGAARGLGEGTVAVESSTLTRPAVLELQRVVGARFVDAPVVGTLPQAESGALVVLAGGEADALDAARPVLEVLGSVRHLGPVGSGTAMKLAVNSWFAMQVEAMAEAIALAEAGGLDKDAAVEVLAALPITSAPLAGLGAGMVRGPFPSLFPIRLVAKDLRYATRARADLPLLEACADRFSRAEQVGLGDDNIHGVVQLIG